jgi:hexosaminidase
MRKFYFWDILVLTVVLVISILVIAVSANAVKSMEAQTQHNIIPKPFIYSFKTGTETAGFNLIKDTKIYVQGPNPDETNEICKIGQYLASKLNPSTGFSIPVYMKDEFPTTNAIILTTMDGDPTHGPESYQLVVTKNLIALKAYKPEGLFRGIQTIRQLLPADIEKDSLVAGVAWTIPCCRIIDYPVYPRRGMMLDVARHFFSVDEVKRVIDLIAQYKMNIFHLHLTDDQGWRIEIKSWPKLTTVGGRSEIWDKPVPEFEANYYYTQDQYVDIVNYAKERYITIVPEIDMPGHCNAALMSYSLLIPGDETPKPTWRVDSNGVLNNEVGFSWLTFNRSFYPKKTAYAKLLIISAIKELAAITPGNYIHIGNDEISSSASKKHFSYEDFINFVSSTVIACNKKIIAWDPEISNSGYLSHDFIKQVWGRTQIELLQLPKNSPQKKVASMADLAYLDQQYAKDCPPNLGQTWASYISTQKAYDWDPTNYPGYLNNCVGIQAALWTETIGTVDDIELMTFPRLLGYAEIGWTPKSMRNWDEYKMRLAAHGPRMTNQGIKFYKSPLVPWLPKSTKSEPKNESI